jgi:YggT family protein
MAAIIGFLFFILTSVLRLFVIALIINAVLSWLVAFDVINYRNRFVASLAEVLDRIVSPVLEPLRRIIPPLGGVDLTPIVAIILIQGIMIYLLPASQAALLSIVGGY